MRATLLLMDRAAVRRMVDGQRAAARRSLEAARPLAPDEAFAEAMALWRLCPDLLEQPPDAVRLREESSVRATWALLRKRLG